MRNPRYKALELFETVEIMHHNFTREHQVQITKEVIADHHEHCQPSDKVFWLKVMAAFKTMLWDGTIEKSSTNTKDKL